MKLSAGVAIAAMLMGSSSVSAKDDNRITGEEIKIFLNEADDFIDDIPEGNQDRQADAILHALRGSGMELQLLRESRNKVIDYSGNVEVTDFTPLDGVARGVKMRLYRPKDSGNEKLPLLIYLHGGGWTFGSLNSCASFCDALVAKGGVGVLAVDYSLAPEKPFPYGLSDCKAAAEYAFENAAELGTDKELISIGGDSAGGNLALAVALSMVDSSEKGSGADRMLKSVVLFYPVVSLDNENVGSWKEYSRGYGLDRRLMDAFVMAYDNRVNASAIRKDTDMDPLKSPLYASDESLGKLPPVLLVSAERDILADQGKAFSARIDRLGKEITHVVIPGSVHLFITVAGQPAAFRKSVELTSRFLTSPLVKSAE